MTVVLLLSQLPGILTLGTRFVPTAMNIVRKLAEAGQNAAATANEAHRNTPVAPKGVHNGVNASSDSSEVTDSGYSSILKED